MGRPGACTGRRGSLRRALLLLVVLGLMAGCSGTDDLQDGGIAGLTITDGASAVVTSPFGASGTVIDVTGGAAVTRLRSAHNAGRREVTVVAVDGYRPPDPTLPVEDPVPFEPGEGCRLETVRVDVAVQPGRADGDEVPARTDAEPFDGALVVPGGSTLVLWVDSTWLDDDRGCEGLEHVAPGPVWLDALRGGSELSFATSSGEATEGISFVRGLEAYLARAVRVERRSDPALDAAADPEEG